MSRRFFDRFRNVLLELGSDAISRKATLLGSERDYELFYIPFEHVNASARLVLVGITPGNTQLELAYAEAQRLLCAGASETEVLMTVKHLAAFGGRSMRSNLRRMLQHFGFDRILGISAAEELWGNKHHLLHATSVVPHAAFRAGKMFAGKFAEVQRSQLLNTCFIEGFVGSVRAINPEAVYVALGPTPLDALRWCVEHNHLRDAQVLGSFAHPSGASGSQVGYYLREKTQADLTPGDPVLNRCGWLDQAYAGMRARTAALLQNVAVPTAPSVPPKIVAAGMAMSNATPKAAPIVGATGEAREQPNGLHFRIKRGRDIGMILIPHVHEDGCYVVSPTRFERDYIRVPQGQPLTAWLKKGLKLRMSNPAERTRAPTLIAPESIEGTEE